MINNMVFEKVANVKLMNFQKWKKTAVIKWIDDVSINYEKTEEELEMVAVLRTCFSNGYVVPVMLHDFFAELVRDEIANNVAKINYNTDPMTAINSVDEAFLYSELYYIFTERESPRF